MFVLYAAHLIPANIFPFLFVSFQLQRKRSDIGIQKKSSSTLALKSRRANDLLALGGLLYAVGCVTDLRTLTWLGETCIQSRPAMRPGIRSMRIQLTKLLQQLSVEERKHSVENRTRNNSTSRDKLGQSEEPKTGGVKNEAATKTTANAKKTTGDRAADAVPRAEAKIVAKATGTTATTQSKNNAPQPVSKSTAPQNAVKSAGQTPNPVTKTQPATVTANGKTNVQVTKPTSATPGAAKGVSAKGTTPTAGQQGKSENAQSVTSQTAKPATNNKPATAQAPKDNPNTNTTLATKPAAQNAPTTNITSTKGNVPGTAPNTKPAPTTAAPTATGATTTTQSKNNAQLVSKSSAAPYAPKTTQTADKQAGEKSPPGVSAKSTVKSTPVNPAKGAVSKLNSTGTPGTKIATQNKETPPANLNQTTPAKAVNGQTISISTEAIVNQASPTKGAPNSATPKVPVPAKATQGKDKNVERNITISSFNTAKPTTGPKKTARNNPSSKPAELKGILVKKGQKKAEKIPAKPKSILKPSTKAFKDEGFSEWDKLMLGQDVYIQRYKETRFPRKGSVVSEMTDDDTESSGSGSGESEDGESEEATESSEQSASESSGSDSEDEATATQTGISDDGSESEISSDDEFGRSNSESETFSSDENENTAQSEHTL